MPASYLTPAQAQTRLASYGITHTPLERTLLVASDDLDLKGPFWGEKYLETQYREFPRTVTIQDDTVNTVPERVLDWVALRAYQLGRDDDSPVMQEAVSGLSARYTRGKKSKVSRLMRNLLRYYRQRAVEIV